MDIERIIELKQKLAEVQVMLQTMQRDLKQEVEDISTSYISLNDNDIQPVSLCTIRKALNAKERKTRWITAMQNIERTIAVNDYNIIV